MEPSVKRAHNDADDLGSDGYSAKRPLIQPVAAETTVMNKMAAINPIALRLMQKAGWSGAGLGVNEQGITAPIATQSQFGRGGLGTVSLMQQRVITDHELENVDIDQTIDWMPENSSKLPEGFDGWMKEGPPIRDLSTQTAFGSAAILKEMLSCKSMLDSVDDRVMHPARARANPFEVIKKEFFMNRAALKLANIDAIFDWAFTTPACLKEGGSLYFADVCAGPGGFSEYVFWRKKWHTKGFGFTLKGDHDFTVDKFNAETPKVFFHTYYGVDKTGDVYNTASIRAFREIIARETRGEMLHVLTADGGFDVTANENIQEVLNRQLFLCQCVTALAVLRKGGNFVCKLFDSYTHFTIGLIFLLRQCFERTCIFKPVTSRPANSERYVVCMGLKTENAPVVEYLLKVNDRINAVKPASTLHLIQQSIDVIEIVPTAMMDEAYLAYMRQSNDFLGRMQVHALKKLHKFIQDTTLPSEDQASIREKCLNKWNIPLNGIEPRINMRQAEYFSNRIKKQSTVNIDAQPAFLADQHIKGDRAVMRDVSDWMCVAMGNESKSHCFIIGEMRHDISIYTPNKKGGGRWEGLEGSLLLPEGTCLLGEVVKYEGHKIALQVWDAMMIAYQDVQKESYSRRRELIADLLHNLHRDREITMLPFQARGRMIPLMLKQALPLKDIRQLEMQVQNARATLPCDDGFQHDANFLVSGVIALPVVCAVRFDPKGMEQETSSSGEVMWVNKISRQRIERYANLSFRASLEGSVKIDRNAFSEIAAFVDHKIAQEHM